ncbi:hypothetical protein G3145_001988 [Salmonella enterica subsp. enterica serovar Montevideo]|uniref:hypothetical protein n=1 Tax=Salmonella enterica TaxID=28901 RepID=UPI0019DEC0AF|nr:hypothetical protein [Salmonella enterica subsp. arizonae]EDU0937363.1 hypothetical protein [Salmonella enterica subsp. arizonae serovar 48:z4,z24:-]EEB1518663.1 hypothetical protein [Salmonella enterica subsp. enterica serovar Montevideo]EEN3771893.1 hypothetical protein [Salmonella enterica]MBA2170763.1 hypothetical protein [Salmonella enterica subsp. arizonae serovar 51:z4,z23:-]HCM1862547.1 hypothetical protein [Salmonella enterica subsp. houtenae serovar 43:z4,z32:-]
MEQVTAKGKQISYRPRKEVRDFLEGNAAKTYRSVQGMIDYLMDHLMEMEKKGELNIR